MLSIQGATCHGKVHAYCMPEPFKHCVWEVTTLKNAGLPSPVLSAAVVAIESAVAIKYNAAPVALSREALLDCTNGELFPYSDGCNGGFVQDAFDFLQHYTLPAVRIFLREGSWPCFSYFDVCCLLVVHTGLCRQVCLIAPNTPWQETSYPYSSGATGVSVACRQPMLHLNATDDAGA